MKKIRLVLTVFAFSGAIIGALVSKVNASLPPPHVYGHTTSGVCVPRPQALQQGCSINGSGPQCTVFVPGSPQNGPNQVAPAFENSSCTYMLRQQ
jgi:hypothetical protein